jgi:hypothetical protein
MCTIISKYNISLNGFEDRQLGGYMLNTIERNKNLNLKWGFYYNKEFFGDFFVPLVGIDWKINNRNKIFGVLPSRLIYEHQLSETVYAGGLFETITTSYPGAPETPSNQTTAVHWYRIDDNKVSLYIDYYPVKKIALRLEMGHSIFRRIRNSLQDFQVNDNIYFRLQANYRLRF